MIVAFQTQILLRALGEKGIKDLYQKYLNEQTRPHVSVKPNDKSIRLASLAKKVGYKTAAKQAGVAPEVIYRAVNKVSKYNFFVE